MVCPDALPRALSHGRPHVRAPLSYRSHGSYRIFYVENDSTDGTRALLSRLASQSDGRVSGVQLAASPLHSTALCGGGVRNCRSEPSRDHTADPTGSHTADSQLREPDRDSQRALLLSPYM